MLGDICKRTDRFVLLKESGHIFIFHSKLLLNVLDAIMENVSGPW